MKEPKPDIALKYTEPTVSTAPPEQRIETVWGKIRVVSAVPTWTPKGTQEDSMALYVSGSTSRLYFYDFTNREWRYFTNTRIGAEGETPLEGDVEIAGGDVSQAGNTITIASAAPYYGQSSDSHTFTSLAQSKDLTFNIGFDPKAIIWFGKLANNSLSAALTNSVPDTNFALFPSVWIDGSHKLGVELGSGTGNENIVGDINNGFATYTSDLSNIVRMYVQSHDDTNTVFRFRRELGASDQTLYYRFYFIAFP